MNVLIATIVGGAGAAFVWHTGYKQVVSDFSPEHAFFYKDTAHIAFSATTGVIGFAGTLLMLSTGVERKQYRLVKDSKGKVVYNPNCVLKIGSKTWNEDEFCGHFIITGKTGFGKTVAYMQMVADMLQRVPDMGGMVIDAKGDLLPIFKKLMAIHGRSDDLIVVEAKNPAIHHNWIPPHRINFIGDRTVPYSTRGKLLSDAIDALFSGEQNPFFKQQGPDWFAAGLELIDELGEVPNIETVGELFSDIDLMEEKITKLEGMMFDNPTPQRKRLTKRLRDGLVNLESDGQREGILGSVRNMVRMFLTPGIKDTFCSMEKDTFQFSDMDKGKIILVSVSQDFPGERKAIFMLMKLAAYRHGKRRFDNPEQIDDSNLIPLFYDEFQNYVTTSEDGETDISAIDQLRAAKMPIIAGTQSRTSLVAAFRSKEKAQTFLLNCSNSIILRSADEDCAKMAAETIGKKMKWERSYSAGGGRSESVTKSKKVKYKVESFRLRELPKLVAYVDHVLTGTKKLKLQVPKVLFKKS